MCVPEPPAAHRDKWRERVVLSMNGDSAHPRGIRLALAWLWAMLRMRCPRCRQGRMFRGSFAMNDPCPVCGLLFQREEGYFLGAMYGSYVLGSVVLGLLYLLAAALLPEQNGAIVVLVALIPYLFFVPVIFRYSRVTWVYFERLSSPVDEAAGAYEKMRLREIANEGHGTRGRRDA